MSTLPIADAIFSTGKYPFTCCNVPYFTKKHFLYSLGYRHVIQVLKYCVVYLHDDDSLVSRFYTCDNATHDKTTY